jgi:hypothetical protein
MCWQVLGYGGAQIISDDRESDAQLSGQWKMMMCQGEFHCLGYIFHYSSHHPQCNAFPFLIVASLAFEQRSQAAQVDKAGEECNL